MPFEPIRIGNTVITKAKTNAYEIKNEASPHLMKSIKASSFEATDVLTLDEAQVTFDTSAAGAHVTINGIVRSNDEYHNVRHIGTA